ncbi:hypothetical protein [Microbacterium sp.]|uniref:hypothetical protein n=1 Tax=Microbacterium sp. TaxID=51671 RepID=UPI003A8E501D
MEKQIAIKLGAAVLGAVAVAGMLAGCTPSGAKPDPTPSDVAAGGGPLPADVALTAAEQKCLDNTPNPPWYQGMANFEVHDSDRTHLYPCATFGGSMGDENRVLAYSASDVYATPYNIVDRGPDELFVYGGGYGDNPAASGSFVARVEPGSLHEVWRRVLINTNATDEWNYPGVLNVLADGSLLVGYGYHMARLDPDTGKVLAQATLPTGDSLPRDTAYNGYDALPDGTIIAKTVNRQPGCTEEGFSAFLKCPDPASAPASVLVAIDPHTLKIIDQVTLPEMMGGRVTTTVYDGTDMIYLPGATKLYRYTFTDGKLAPDPDWGPVSYLKNGQTAASAMAVIGDQVVGMTNGGGPTSTPMSVFSVSQADSSKGANLQPFADSGAKNSFIPSMVSVDPENHRVYVMDAGAGMLGAVDVGEATLTKAWTQKQRTLSFTTLIGPADHRVLIGTDIPVKNFNQLKSYTGEQVVWRDAASGRELARTSTLPKMNSGILVTPGYGGLQYFLTADGHIITLQVTPVPTPEPTPSPTK